MHKNSTLSLPNWQPNLDTDQTIKLLTILEKAFLDRDLRYELNNFELKLESKEMAETTIDLTNFITLVSFILEKEWEEEVNDFFSMVEGSATSSTKDLGGNN